MRAKLGSVALTAAGVLLPMIVSKMSRKAVEKGYEKVRRRPPPKDPTNREVSWGDAVAWSIVAGVTGSLAKLVLRRGMSSTKLKP